MKLLKFKEVNCTYAKDQPEYLPLPAHRQHDEHGEIVFCWGLDLMERLVVLFTGKVWHRVLTFNQPLQPQHLGTAKPEMKGTND